MKQDYSDSSSELNFFKNLETNFEQSEDELWEKIEQKTTQKNTQVPRKRVIRLKRIRYAVAATVLLMCGVSSILRFYTETIV